MVKVQEWLDKEYPKSGTCIRKVDQENYGKARNQIIALDISNQILEGDLDLVEFTGLQEINLGGNPQLGELKNKPWSTEIKIPSQEWLEWKYPDKANVREIKRKSGETLQGKLVIESFPILEKIVIRGPEHWMKGALELQKHSFPGLIALDKWENQIQELVICHCPKLQSLDASNNQELTSFDLDNCSNLEMIHLFGNPKLNGLNLTGVQRIRELKLDYTNLNNLDLSLITQLQKLDISRSKLTKLDASNCLQLSDLSCSYNKLNKLKLGKLEHLTRLNCGNNQLQELDISQCLKLKSFDCSNNLLAKLNLANNNQLEKLNIGNNNFSQDLTIFSELKNLEELWIGNNNFFGSLKPLQNLNKLRSLHIADNDIDSGLEYLQEGLQYLYCYAKENEKAKVKKICGELFLYAGNLKAWREAHPKLVIKVRGEIQMNNSYHDKPLKLVTDIPLRILNQRGEEIRENHNYEGINYQGFALRDARNFSWENNQNKTLSFQDLPIKLYNIKTEKVEWTQDDSNIKSYAILSYVWGSRKDKEAAEDFKVTYQQGNEEHEKELTMTKWGKKALEKARKTCQFFKIDHLWMDQLCIDQNSTEEQNQEVPKMGKYYGNAGVTLIPINTKAEEESLNEENKKEFALETLKKIVSSQWFTRSWTYQEGLLSKQTVFMFDDTLIDGRVLAQVLGLVNSHNEDGSYNELNKEPEKFATLFGWTYCKDVNKSENGISLRLYEALKAVKNRRRGTAVDGIYSILGLLPYGEKVKVEYKKRGHKYTKEELSRVLQSVMEIALKEGYGEPLAWFGARRNVPFFPWLPEIETEDDAENGKIHGSTNIQGGTNVFCQSNNLEFVKTGIKLNGLKYPIKGTGFKSKGATSTGFFSLNVYREDKNDIHASSSLWGLEKTLKLVKKGDILVIPDEEEWKSENGLAILVPGKDNPDCPMDIVELSYKSRIMTESYVQKLVDSKAESKKLLIDMVNKKVIEGEENIAQYEAQIQVNPYQK